VIAETPVTFGRHESLVGVWCAPERDAASVPAAVFINAGIIHRVGPGRLHVHMARALAAAGFPSLRFDLGGLGDSVASRAERGTVLEWVKRDIRDAIDYAAARGSGRVVLVGLCSGADNAIDVAPDDPRVVGLVLLDPNVHRTRAFRMHHFLRAARSPQTWRLLVTGRHPVLRRLGRRNRRPADSAPATPFLAPSTLPPRELLEQRLHGLTERGCRLFYFFTGGLPFRYNHARQFARTFPRLPYGSAVEVHYRGDWDHTFSDPQAQATLIESVREWFARVQNPRAA